jgi:hypothetical protein
MIAPGLLRVWASTVAYVWCTRAHPDLYPMQRYTASRLTAGNRLFPAQLHIDDMGVTLKKPSLFSGQETSVPYSRIASVNIECPVVGYSTIHIQTTGEGMITVHGFLRREVEEMKHILLGRIQAVGG